MVFAEYGAEKALLDCNRNRWYKKVKFTLIRLELTF